MCYIVLVGQQILILGQTGEAAGWVEQRTIGPGLLQVTGFTFESEIVRDVVHAAGSQPGTALGSAVGPGATGRSRANRLRLRQRGWSRSRSSGSDATAALGPGGKSAVAAALAVARGRTPATADYLSVVAARGGVTVVALDQGLVVSGVVLQIFVQTES